MAARYNSSQLLVRNNIIQTQKLLTQFLDTNRVNTLIHLFDCSDNTYNSDDLKIRKYIEDERKLRGMDDTITTIKSSIYGYNKGNTSFNLKIYKHNELYLHLSIHISPNRLEPKHNGMIHIYKDIYKQLNNSTPNRALYALISVKQPNNKPNSLEFSIADGYTTPNSKNAAQYDPDIQKEMDVIITVLNRIFDEDNTKYYIGNIAPIHKNTNIVLNNMNSRTAIVTRKNKGTKINPAESSEPAMNLYRKPRNNRRTLRRVTRRKGKNA